jgi:predicted NUDIX family NTP pyrophosphohydrolase
MAKVVSAGLMMYRMRGERLEVLLAHPGGPYNAGRHDGVWSIPKGEVNEGEELLAAARREFSEEVGRVPEELAAAAGDPAYLSLGGVKYKNHKVVHAWAFEGDCDPSTVTSNTFEMEWPRGSGRTREFPEIDRAAWFDTSAARAAILSAQARFLYELEALVGAGAAGGGADDATGGADDATGGADDVAGGADGAASGAGAQGGGAG